MSVATFKSSANAPVCQYPDCKRSAWQDASGSYAEFCGTRHRDAMAVLNRPQLCKVLDSFTRTVCRIHLTLFPRTVRLDRCASRAIVVRTRCASFCIYSMLA